MLPSEHLRNLIGNDNPGQFFEDAELLVNRINDPACTKAFFMLKNEYNSDLSSKIIGIISSSEANLYRRQLTNKCLLFIDRYIVPNDDLLTGWEEEQVDISIDDLKKSLEQILQLNGIEELIFVVEELVKNLTKKLQLQHLKTAKDKAEYEKNETFRYSFSREGSERQSQDGYQKNITAQRAFEAELNRIKEQAKDIIQSFDEREDLKPGWQRTAARMEQRFWKERSSTGRTFLLSPLDVIQIPKYLKSEQSAETYLRYKRMMIRAQDAYIAQDYDLAYNLFLEVRNDIDPESPQLYEYLLTSYYRKHHREELIDKLFPSGPTTAKISAAQRMPVRRPKTQLPDGSIVTDSFPVSEFNTTTTGRETDPLLPLYLYANRFRHLQDDPAGNQDAELDNYPGSNRIVRPVHKIYSHSGKINIQNVAQELLAKLLHKYVQLVYEGNSGKIKQRVDLQCLQKCIVITNEIYRHFQPDELLFKAIVPELLGAGYGFWITIDEFGRTVNTAKNFDAIGHFREMLNIVISEKVIQRKNSIPATEGERRSDLKQKIEQEVTQDIARAVQDKLLLKYIRLKKVKNANVREEVAPLIELIISYRVANSLFPNSGLFYELPIRELSGSKGKVDWFELGRGRELLTRFTHKNNTFPAFEYFDYFLRVRDEFENSFRAGSAAEQLIGQQYRRLREKTTGMYERLRDDLPYELNKASELQVSTVKDCLQNWQICFDVEEDETFLSLCYQELIGNGKLFWWSIGPDGLHANTTYLSGGPHLDARHELAWLIDKCGFGTKADAHHTLIFNYFNRIVIPHTNQIGKTVFRQFNPARTHYADILYYVDKLLQLCDRFGPVAAFGNYIFEELVEENIFPWLDVTATGIINHEKATDRNINPLPSLNRAQIIFAGDNRFSFESLQDKIALNRLEDIEYVYQKDFGRLQNMSYQEDIVVHLCKIVEDLIDYHKITGNSALLAIPYEELVTGKGKISWARTGFIWGPSVRLTTNQEGEITSWKFRLPGLVFGRVWPRSRVSKVAHFDFIHNYLYVLKHYRHRGQGSRTKAEPKFTQV